MKQTILFIDDDQAIVRLVSPVLKDAGFRVRHADDADEAAKELRDGTTHLILLDIGLPGISGMKLLEIIKQDAATAKIPIIMITSKGEVDSKVKGLKTGADDYLVKPFSTAELLARVQALLRRTYSEGQTESFLEAGGIRIDFDRHEVTARGKKVDLKPTEFDLLAVLLRRKGIVMTYNNLSDSLTDGSRVLTSGNLYTLVKNLREKLGPAGKSLQTLYGIGYKFEEEV